MHELLKGRTVVSILPSAVGTEGGPVVFTSTGDKFIYTAPAPVRLLKWGILIKTALVPVTQCLLTLSRRPTIGSDSGRVAIDTLRTGTTSYAVGKGLYRDPFTASTEASTPSSMPTGGGPLGYTQKIDYGQGQFQLIPGEEWVVDVTTAATTTGEGYIWIEMVELPITKPSSYGTTDAGTTSLTENYTRLAS